MNYKKIYHDFIADRQKKPVPDGYVEKHHILPRSLGGNNDSKNLILLSAGDHLFAHILLARIYGGGMWAALNQMCNFERYKGSRSRKHYAIARENCAKLFRGKKRSEEDRAKISAATRGRKLSEEQKKAIALRNIGRKNSDETRKKISAANKGRTISAAAIEKMKTTKSTPECRAKMSAVHKGVPKSEEHKRKISATLTGREGHKHTEEFKETQRKLKTGDGNPMKRPEVAAKMAETLRLSGKVSGKNNWNYGRKKTPEQKAKCAEAAYERSQGSIWVTNGEINRFIKNEAIPDGWRRGKVHRKAA